MNKPKSFPEHDIHLPEPIRWAIQPMMRALMLGLAGYTVEIEGKLPKEPSLLAAYPHGEHANSILLPPNDIVYMAAADHWYSNLLLQIGMAAVVDTVPVVREGASPRHRTRELELQSDVLNKRKKHLLVYPQGTRRGQSESAYKLRGELKRGIAYMAHYHQKQTIPIGFVYPEDFQPLKGGENAWTNVKKRLTGKGRLVPITVQIGEPVEPPHDHTRPAFELYLNVLARELFNLANQR